MLFESGKIEDVEYQIYELLFHDTAAEFALDGAVYIDSSPEVCFQRIAKRARAGESVIPLDYLTNCCDYYNRWLVPEQVTELPTHATSPPKFPILHLDTNADATYLDTDPEDCGKEWIRKVVEFATSLLEKS